MAARYDKPVLGLNFGHVGFLTAAQPGETEKIDALLSGRVLPSRRMMLSLCINGEERDLALNEIMLAPKNRGKLLACSLAVNGRRLAAFRADALLFHTPTGSTSYAFSAGGAVCSEDLECIGVKAVAPYMRRGGHHMLFAPGAVFRPLEVACPGCPPEAVADGRDAIPLAPDDRVEIRRAARDLVLLFTEPHDNHFIFCEKQREAGREQP